MALEAGVVYIPVLPNTTLFTAELEKKLGATALAGPTKALSSVEREASRLATTIGGPLGRGLGKVQSEMGLVGRASVGTQVAFTAIGAVAVKSLASAVSATEDLAGQVKGLQRITGQSAEDASKLSFIYRRYGVDASAAGAAVGIFAKQLINGGKATDMYGLSLTNADGSQKSFNQVLGEAADKYLTLAPGLERTAFAMNVFGRGGRTMIPILNQGSAGIAHLSDEAEKLGVVLSQDNVDAVTKLRIAQRELDESLLGLKVRVGEDMIPVLTTFTHVAQDVVGVFDEIPGPIRTVLLLAAAGVGTLSAFGLAIHIIGTGLGTFGIGAAKAAAAEGVLAAGSGVTTAALNTETASIDEQIVALQARNAAMAEAGPAGAAGAGGMGLLSGALLGVGVALGAVVAGRKLADLFNAADARNNAKALQGWGKAFVETGGSARLFTHDLSFFGNTVKATVAPSQQLGEAFITLGKSGQLKSGGALQFGQFLRSDLIPAFQAGKVSLGDFLGLVDSGAGVFGTGMEGARNYRDALNALLPAIVAGQVNQHQLNVLAAEGKTFDIDLAKAVTDYKAAQAQASAQNEIAAQSTALINSQLAKVHESYRGATGDVSTFAQITGQSFDAVKGQMADFARQASDALSDPEARAKFSQDWQSFLDNTKQAVAQWHDQVASGFDLSGPLSSLASDEHLTIAKINQSFTAQIAVQQRWGKDTERILAVAGASAKPFISQLASMGDEGAHIADVLAHGTNKQIQDTVGLFNKGQGGAQTLADKLQTQLIGSLDHLTRAFNVMISSITKIPLNVLTQLEADTDPAQVSLNRLVTKTHQLGFQRVVHTGGWITAAPVMHGGGLRANEVLSIPAPGSFIVNRKAARTFAPILDALAAGKMHGGGATERFTIPGPEPAILEVGEFQAGPTMAAVHGPLLEAMNAAVPRYHEGGRILPIHHVARAQSERIERILRVLHEGGSTRLAVAAAGFEPASRGYEPGKAPLLHTAPGILHPAFVAVPILHAGGPIPDYTITTPGQPEHLGVLAATYDVYASVRPPSYKESVDLLPGWKPDSSWRRPKPGDRDRRPGAGSGSRPGQNVHDGGWWGDGGELVVRRPTVIGVGERGPEVVRVTPLSEIRPVQHVTNNYEENNTFNEAKTPAEQLRELKFLRASRPTGMAR